MLSLLVVFFVLFFVLLFKISAMQKGDLTSCESYFQGCPYNKNMAPHRETSEQK